ncbi:hypothetical protein, partial [Burkholderia mallei]|uniref:hypothetical protein n=3 Tax=Burkholderia mallei TaxID=13373 RepID=UPI001C7E1A72
MIRNYRYPALLSVQGSGVKPIVMFSAPAAQIEKWAGVPQKKRFGDLPPTNRASRSLVKFVFGEEDEHEEALYGTANHRVSEGSRGR